jgi:hypothetical protein
MIDVMYVGVVAAFFALMAAYISGCVALGKEDTSDTERP